MGDYEGFLDKKENWATWEDEEKKFITYLLGLENYLGEIMAKLDGGNKPDPTTMENEIHRLKAYVDELSRTEDELKEKIIVRTEAYSSTLVEIYKMPGCIDDLLDLLKSSGIDWDAADMIEEEWRDQYCHHMRERGNKSSKLQKDIISEGKKLLTRKRVEIQKARIEMDKLDPQIFKVVELLSLARDALSLALKSADSKHVSSSSRSRSPSPKERKGRKSNIGSSSSFSYEERKYNSVSSSPSSSFEERKYIGASSTLSSSEGNLPSPRDNKRARK